MIMIQGSHIHKYFAADPVLVDVNLDVRAGECVGLVGANGAGKSTLLQILTGQMLPDQGAVHTHKQARIGYLAQRADLDPSLTIWDEMLSVFSALIEQEKELRHLEQQIGEGAAGTAPENYDQILETYSRQSEAFKNNGGYRYEADIRNVLNGLQFGQTDPYHTKIGSLSGGQKTRLSLGKLLLSRPDVLILDEPTNYLDIRSMEWLEQFLHLYEGAILVVSHDRFFLNKLSNVVYEIENARATRYNGNYDEFVKQKEERLEKAWKDYEKQQKEIKEMETFIQKNIARDATSGRAKSRRKQLEKIEKLPPPGSPKKKAAFSFDIARQSGNDVLKAEHLSVGHTDQPLLQDLSFEITRGDRVALYGPNGIGKSTLIKTLAGNLAPLAGNIRQGTNVSIGYYDQEQEDLNPDQTVLKELWNTYPALDEESIRTTLGQFLFSGDQVDKTVAQLSGGEKARLSLSKLMLKRANLLILDEPTNHLDTYSREVLEQALIDYPGTLVFISHDRYFLNRLSSRILELSSDGIRHYPGNYEEYVEKKQEEKEVLMETQNQAHPHTASTSRGTQQKDKQDFEKQKARQREARKRQRRLEELEQQIEHYETAIAEAEQMLCDPEIFQDSQKSQEWDDKRTQLEHELQALMEEWEDWMQAEV